MGFYLGATSNLTSGYHPPFRRSRDVPADLEAMSEICRAQLDVVRSQIPSICVVGEMEDEGGEFGNGASISSAFQFSCQGTRNEVIDVVGTLGRVVIQSRPSNGR